MKRASDQFTSEQRQQVSDAVKEAESKTSAEIVPVVASASGRYDRPEDIVGLWLAIIALIVTWLLVPDFQTEPGSWGGWPTILKLAALIVAVVAGFVVGAMIGSQIAWLRRLFTPRRQMKDEVELRTRQVFFDRRVHHTESATGVLVYVSLFERMAVVLADQVVTEKIGQPAVDEMCTELTNSLRSGSIVDALCNAIHGAGNRLHEVLPRSDDNVNELADALVTID